MPEKPDNAQPAEKPKPFQFSLSTLLIAVGWVAITLAVLRTFGPPWPVEVYDWRRVEPYKSADGMFATLIELIVFLAFMQVWRLSTRKIAVGPPADGDAAVHPESASLVLAFADTG